MKDSKEMSEVLLETNRKVLNRKLPLPGIKLVNKFALFRPKQDIKTFQMLIQGKKGGEVGCQQLHRGEMVTDSKAHISKLKQNRVSPTPT